MRAARHTWTRRLVSSLALFAAFALRAEPVLLQELATESGGSCTVIGDPSVVSGGVDYGPKRLFDRVLEGDYTTRWLSTSGGWGGLDASAALAGKSVRLVSYKLYQLQKGYGCNGRAPTSWKIQGRNSSDDEWTDIDAVTDFVWPWQTQGKSATADSDSPTTLADRTATFEVEDAAFYLQYRILPLKSNLSDTYSYGLNEVEFYVEEGEPEPDPYPSYLAGMTGGETITNGTYEIHTFNENGTLTVPSGVMADILVVAGGGGGGTPGSSGNQYTGAGGGGGGGVRYKKHYALAAGTYAVTVGAGGAAGVYDARTSTADEESCLRIMGQTGGDSSIAPVGGEALILSHGGGGGAGGHTGFALKYRTGKDGGSGGGGGSGTSAPGGSGIAGEGYAGKTESLPDVGGGGGGAGGAATNKNGGVGRAIDITGETVYYGGGCGGWGNWFWSKYEGRGGAGGGGDSTRCYLDNGLENYYYRAQDGTDGLGGGGGAGNRQNYRYSSSQPGRGGSGVVIVRVSAVNPDSYDPQIGSVGRVETTATTASFDVGLASFGKDQAGGTLKVAYGLDPDDLSALETLAVTVAPGTTNVTLTGLKPDSAYYARVSLENGLSRTFVYGETLLFVTPARHAGASGGEISYLDGDVIHKFVSNGVLTIRSSCTVRMLLVAGGGGGGGYGGGGGGAGGVLVLDEAYLPQGKYAVTVGAGGQGGYWGGSVEKRHGANGGDSVIAYAGGAELYRAYGGGGGGTGCASGVAVSYMAGSSGGSGGGEGYDAGSKIGANYVGLGTPGQGYEGGVSDAGSCQAYGGGGAGRCAFPTANNKNGAGGTGVTNDITGVDVVYGGGGGGSANEWQFGKNPGAGGLGGGGAGADGIVLKQTTKAGDGTDGLGGGGGGGGQITTGEGHVGGNGGSGVVIVRYAEPADDDPDPYVVFASVDSVEAHRATLTGRLVAVGAGGSSCTVKVAYGLSSDALVFTNTLSTSQTAGDFAFVLEHLVPNKTWYVALSAVNDRGCGDATAPISFQTPDGEKEEGDVELDGFPTIGTVTAGALTADASVPVSFDVTDLGKDATSATAWVEYGTTPAFGEASTNVAIAATGTATATITNLSLGATYYYAVSVRNDRGYEVKGATQTFTLPTGEASIGQACTFTFTKGVAKVKFAVDSLGLGTHVAKIYVGTSVSTRTLLGTMEVTATGEHTYEGTMDCVNVDGVAYYCAWAVLENTFGGQTFSSESGMSKGNTTDVRDTSTYYWINAGGGNWLDAANWRSSWAPNDYIVGYPAYGSTASYTNANDIATTIRVASDTFAGSLAVGARDAKTLKACDLTLCGSGSETLKMTGGSLKFNTGAKLTFDALTASFGGITLGVEGRFTITNGAVVNATRYDWQSLNAASNVIRICAGSSLNFLVASDYWVRNIGGYGSKIILDGGAFTVPGYVQFNPATLATGAKADPAELVFRGAAPRFDVTGTGNRFAYTGTANIAQPRLTFEIPAEGWAEAPLRSTATSTGVKFFASSVTKTNILVNVSRSSAVFAGGFRGEVPLIRWTSGIDRSQVELGSTGRPSGSFVWYPADAEYPTELRLKVARGFSIIVR